MQRVWAAAAAFLLGLAIAAPGWGDESIFTGETKLLVVVEDLHQALERFDKTSFGQLLNAPMMEEFSKDITRQIDEQGFAKYRLGLEWNDISDLSQGRLSFAYVHPAGEMPGTAVIIGIKPDSEEAQGVIDRAVQSLVDEGFTRRTVDDQDVVITVLDPPPRSDTGDAGAPQDRHRSSQKAYFLIDQKMVVCEGEALAKSLLQNIRTGNAQCLADDPAFAEIMRRCAADAAGASPDIRWFVDPFGLIDARRLEDPSLIPDEEPDPFEVYKQEGFTAVRGLGGWIHLHPSPYDLVHRTFVYAPGPYQNAMRMIRLPNVEGLGLARMIAADSASATAVHVDMLNAFDNFGTLFDKLYGDGEEGFWEDMQDSWANDPQGPKVNLRKDFFEQLSDTSYSIVQYTRPITPESERTLSLTVCKDADQVTDVLARLLTEEPSVRIAQSNGITVFEVFKDEAMEGDPMMVVCSAKGYLFNASNFDVIDQALSAGDSALALMDDARQKTVDEHLKKLVPAETCVYMVTQLGAQIEPYYELFRTNRLSDSKSLTLLSDVVKNIVSSGEEGETKQRFDGSKLPPFEQVNHYLGVFATAGISETDGWMFKGFVLPPHQPPQRP